MRISVVLGHVKQTMRHGVYHDVLPSGTHVLVDAENMLMTTVACTNASRSWLTYFGDDRDQPGVVILPDDGYGHRVLPDFTALPDDVNGDHLHFAVTTLLGP